MKKVLSERNLVVILFLAALTVFSFAQHDANRLEKLGHGSKASQLLPTSSTTAEYIDLQPIPAPVLPGKEGDNKR